jgi:hypothetical protein
MMFDQMRKVDLSTGGRRNIPLFIVKLKVFCNRVIINNKTGISSNARYNGTRPFSRNKCRNQTHRP